MSSSAKRALAIGIIVLALAAIALFLFMRKEESSAPVIEQPAEQASGSVHQVIGTSVQGRPIDAYVYGTGAKHLAFVGGIHGGYEWNSVLLAYQVKDYLDANPDAIPESLTVTVIPSANPDGIFKIIGKEGRFAAIDVPPGSAAAGRFNANGVDLNRNFDCKWQPKSTWQNKEVSAGTKAFSEPEAAALRDFVLKDKPLATVYWHSQSGSAYTSQCENGILPETLVLMNLYAKVSGYAPMTSFDAYATTGGADDWMASVGLPAITAELTTHESIEFEKNLAAVKAMFEHYK